MAAEINSVTNIVKVFGLAATSFVLAMAMTPALTHYLYKYKLWRKKVRTLSPDGTQTPLFSQLHADREIGIPRLGGILIWVTVIAVSVGVWAIAQLTESAFWDKANFLSRNQTWLPLFTLLAASLLGLLDDLTQVFEKGTYIAGGIKFRHRLIAVFCIALAGAGCLERYLRHTGALRFSAGRSTSPRLPRLFSEQYSHFCGLTFRPRGFTWASQELWGSQRLLPLSRF